LAGFRTTPLSFSVAVSPVSAVLPVKVVTTLPAASRSSASTV
jgi:hypothetical protein